MAGRINLQSSRADRVQRVGATLSGLAVPLELFPRVARSSQPWAEGHNPFRIETIHNPFRIEASVRKPSDQFAERLAVFHDVARAALMIEIRGVERYAH